MTRPAPRRWDRPVRLLHALLLPLLVACAGMAQAHAVMLSAEPKDGALLADPPTEVVVRFDEPVSMLEAQVLDPEGRDLLAPGAAESRADGLHLALPDHLGEGSYTVSYHVVSLDGHPVEGSLVFSLGHASGAARPAPEGAAGWRFAFVLARLVMYLGLVGAVGGVAYSWLVRPEGSARDAGWRFAGASAVLGLGATAPALVLHGARLFGGPIGQLFDPATWEAGALSAFGCTALCGAGGLALIAAAARQKHRPGAGALALAGVVLALGACALSGHVVTAGPRWLTSPPLLLHAGAATFWAGSLLPLHRALAPPAREAGNLLQRFSTRAVPAVGLLVLAGLGLAWLQVREPTALAATEYGRLLLAKLALVGGLLGLAVLNRLRLTPALLRGEADAPRRLRRSIRAEVGLVVAVLAVTAALGTAVPPRALLAAEALGAPSHVHAPGGPQGAEVRRLHVMGRSFHGDLAFAPGALGANVVTVTLRDLAGHPLDVMEVGLRAANPGRDIAPIRRPAVRTDLGTWRIEDVTMAAPGTWELGIEVLVSDFERETVRVRLDL
jgi:copper transport protein